MKVKFTVDMQGEQNLFWQVIKHTEDWRASQSIASHNINVIYHNPVHQDFFELLKESADPTVQWDKVIVLPMASLEIDEVGLDRVPPDELGAFYMKYMQEYEDEDDAPPPGTAQGEEAQVKEAPVVLPSPNVRGIVWKGFHVGAISVANVRKAIESFAERYHLPTFLNVPRSTPEADVMSMAFEFNMDVVTGAQEGHVLLA